MAEPTAAHGRHRAPGPPRAAALPAATLPPAPDDPEEWRTVARQYMSRLADLLAAPAGRPLPALPPADPAADPAEWQRAAARYLVSLGELATEITAVVSHEPEFIRFVHDLLRDGAWALGCAFRGEPPPADAGDDFTADRHADLDPGENGPAGLTGDAYYTALAAGRQEDRDGRP